MRQHDADAAEAALDAGEHEVRGGLERLVGDLGGGDAERDVGDGVGAGDLCAVQEDGGVPRVEEAPDGEVVWVRDVFCLLELERGEEKV